MLVDPRSTKVILENLVNRMAFLVLLGNPQAPIVSAPNEKNPLLTPSHDRRGPASMIKCHLTEGENSNICFLNVLGARNELFVNNSVCLPS